MLPSGANRPCATLPRRNVTCAIDGCPAGGIVTAAVGPDVAGLDHLHVQGEVVRGVEALLAVLLEASPQRRREDRGKRRRVEPRRILVQDRGDRLRRACRARTACVR